MKEKNVIDEIIVNTNKRKNDTNKLLKLIDSMNSQKKYKLNKKGGIKNVKK